MADIPIRLRTVPGYQSKIEELNFTNRARVSVMPASDFDARGERIDGSLVLSERAIRRRIRMGFEVLTSTEITTLRRWKANRVVVALNPNWDARTRLYTRFSRQDELTGSPGSIIGPKPTYTRSTGTADTYGSELRPNGLLRLLADDVMRFEESGPLSVFNPLRGARIYGRRGNYFAESHPKSGSLLWSTSGATFVFNANVDSNVEGLVGVGMFQGNSGQYIYRDIGYGGGAGQVSAGVWVKGEGTVSLQFTGGATIESSNMTLQPDTWQLLKLEDIAASGATIQMRMNSKATVTWAQVAGAQFRVGRRLGGYIHNMTSGSVVNEQEDAIYYPFQIPPHSFSISVGVEMPDLFASSGEQVILGVDQGGGDRLVLGYNGTLSKFYFQKKASGINLQWTPQRAAGRGTIITIECSKFFYIAYENNVQVASVVSGVESMVNGLNVGWDGITDTSGWNGLIFFLRVDEGLTPIAEVEYISNMYNDPSILEWTRLAEGRFFEITNVEESFPVGMRFVNCDLVEVDSCRTATTERP